MKFPLFLTFICTLIIKNATGYRTDIEESGEAAFCEHRKHLTFKPSATCCANQVVKPGLDISEFWANCVPQNGGQSDTVEGIGWDIYACILKAKTGKDKLTLQEFADMITTPHYPADIKTKIDAEIQAQSIPAASISDYGRLEKLRVTYYDIEKEVCEGSPSETKSYGNIEMCSSWKEENHRAGMCCSKSYPVDIRYQSLFDVDTLTKERCKQDIIYDLEKRLNATEMMVHSLMEICQVACAMHIKYNFNMKSHILENNNYWNFNVTEQLERFGFLLIPSFIHPSKVAEIKTYLNATFAINDTIEAMQNFEFADVVGGDSYTPRSSNNIVWVHRGNKTAGEDFKYEFMGRRFHKGIMQVPVFCSAYNQLVSLTEHYVFKDCKPEDVTEAPAPAEEPEPKPEAEPEPAVTEPVAATEAAASGD